MSSTTPDTEMTYDEQIKEMTVTKSLKLLRDGFKNELATALFADERTTELFAQLISEFVETNIPVVDDENQMELSMMLLETLDIVAR
jgi:hypothetical protein